MADPGKVYLPVHIFKKDRVVLTFLERFAERVNRLPGGAVTDLNLTISDPPTQAQVQAVSNKVDALLSSLRAAQVISE